MEAAMMHIPTSIGSSAVWLSAVVMIASCGGEARSVPTNVARPGIEHAPWYAAQPAQATTPPAGDATAERYHMRAHFSDLRMVEQLLVAGRLDEGLAIAYLLTRKVEDPALAPWDDHARNVVDTATSLTRADGLADALRREARLAVECAGCHVATRTAPIFGAAPPLPAELLTAEARMARHVWAVDRIWEGLVGPDDDRWSRGLAVLAETPLPYAPLTDAPQLAADLRNLAKQQLDDRATTSADQRAARYGEMLVTCAACHQSIHGAYGVHFARVP